MPIANLFRQGGRWIRVTAEITILSALILTTRSANYADVFFDGKIYFVDAGCYSRMTRARMVAEQPGAIVRRHKFENFPAGISPHTTAPLDYLIVALAAGLRPFSAQPLDLAGAVISPLLALLGGWFLYWWSREFSALSQATALLVYSLSAILVHGTALGRPDHQALLIVLLLVALGAEWQLWINPTRGWGIASGISWALALWVSLYEPLILLGGLVLGSVLLARTQLLARSRRPGWWIFLALTLLAALVERRWPDWPVARPFFSPWSATIGELQPVRLTNPIWLYWSGGLLLVSPLLLLIGARRKTIPGVVVILLALSGGLTLWQARWGYFFALLFVLTIPGQFAFVRQRWLAVALLGLALLPFFQFWDRQLWPPEEEARRRAENRMEAIAWRAGTTSLTGSRRVAIMSPWWLAPATAYWSGHPVVAGSSHESLDGIIESARFYLASSPPDAVAILRRHGVGWVMAGDGGRIAENSATALGISGSVTALGTTLADTPSHAPAFLKLFSQNGLCRVYQVRDLR